MSTENTVVKVAQPSVAELLAKIAQLEAAAKAKDAARNTVTFTVSDTTGAIQANSLGRFPTTLYAEQWERLLDAADKFKLREKIAAWKADGTVSLKGVEWVPKTAEGIKALADKKAKAAAAAK
jgi:hypothetical protein